MTKSPAQIQAEIDEALRAKQWQERIAREEQDRRARIAPTTGPTRTQLYDEWAADRAAGIFHGEQRGRSKDFRKHSSVKTELTAEMQRTLAIAKRDGGWVAAGNSVHAGHVERVSASAIRALIKRGLLTQCYSSEGGLAGRLP